MTRLTNAAAAMLALTGALGLAGWLSGRLVMASLGERFIPMAPITGIAFVLLAVAFTAVRQGRNGRWLAAAIGGAVTLVGVARLAASLEPALSIPELESALVSDAGRFGLVPLARMSPLTAAVLTATGLAALLVGSRPAGRGLDAAGWLGAAVGATGCTVLLGYVYGTPLLYGGRVIPVALPTGFGFVFAGMAAIAAAGSDAAPLRDFAGDGASARLLRAFLPTTVAALLVASAGGHVMISKAQANPALAAACSALAAAALVAAVIWNTAATVGGAIERAEVALAESHAQLEAAVATRTAQLARMNQELDAFTSSVSHDLRAPVRHMAGFAKLLDADCRPILPPKGQTYLDRILSSADRMSHLIEDLLTFARTAQAPLRRQRVELSALVREVIADATRDTGGRVIEWHVDTLPTVSGDPALLRQAFTNVVTNAVKYTGPRQAARIDIGWLPGTVNEQRVIFVRDNGVGFDMAYADKLFGVFQRLHGTDEFEGTGIGLANVRRIVERHGGTVRAEAEVDKGATFYVSLPGEEMLHA